MNLDKTSITNPITAPDAINIIETEGIVILNIVKATIAVVVIINVSQLTILNLTDFFNLKVILFGKQFKLTKSLCTSEKGLWD